MRFFSISISKSGPNLACFVHFDLEMCFAPQRRALFQYLNFQKWSETVGFWTLLTWKCASRHNGVQFFISHLASWLRTRCFSEVTFRPPGAPNHWKNRVNRRLPYLFAHLHLLASHFFSSLIFSLLDFSSLTLPTSAFPSLHVVGSLTSKLPSIKKTKNHQFTKPRMHKLPPLGQNPPKHEQKWNFCTSRGGHRICEKGASNRFAMVCEPESFGRGTFEVHLRSI